MNTFQMLAEVIRTLNKSAKVLEEAQHKVIRTTCIKRRMARKIVNQRKELKRLNELIKEGESHEKPNAMYISLEGAEDNDVIRVPYGECQTYERTSEKRRQRHQIHQKQGCESNEKPTVMYLCDKRKECAKDGWCDDTGHCIHTEDIEHAENFERAADFYFEKAEARTAPEKHGRWIDLRDEEDTTLAGLCSCCGWGSHLYEDDVVGMPYCPNCGAKMEQEVER